jgi:hypothetical protein
MHSKRRRYGNACRMRRIAPAHRRDGHNRFELSTNADFKGAVECRDNL